ncbi:MAG: HigA family addiction module antidote protein [Bacteroidales bacterium]|nr:HigA family addiction module antidote protein [Bacteroidales bacterium]
MIHVEGIDDKMIANNLTPFEATHPGDVIKDELGFRGISQRKLAETTGIAYSVLNEVLNGKRALTTDYALLIGKAIDIDAEFLIRMQADYDMQTAKRNPKLIMRLNNIRKIAAVF